ncbi:AmmeMemoRadiSam system protein B [candidate division WOR-3 bacterium]|nr:AmmeMemoRadiSam system protein B [candidate division WOR-3 bacterium]
MHKKIREPSVAGQFYPGDKPSLEKTLSEIFSGAGSSRQKGKVLGLVLPHAGYPFSGSTTAKAVDEINPKEYKNPSVIILAPCHRFASKKASVFSSGSWKTPLGLVSVDETLAQSLLENASIFDDSELPHLTEHSIEVQLPFFQHIFKNQFSLVPVAVGNQSPEFCAALGETLQPFAGEDRILVASSDLYHGYSLSECLNSDSELIQAISEYNLTLVSEILARGTKASEHAGCGIGPILAVMKALESSKQEIFLAGKANSAESPFSSAGYVVGYSSFVIK